ncbi:hypothetical protein CGRA01v4_00590 [Colletotrichum graminicola]|nr:hypothetical protein CGRA01v4_00590 [Colletotrichum graminicola]
MRLFSHAHLITWVLVETFARVHDLIGFAGGGGGMLPSSMTKEGTLPSCSSEKQPYPFIYPRRHMASVSPIGAPSPPRTVKLSVHTLATPTTQAYPGSKSGNLTEKFLQPLETRAQSTLSTIPYS